MQNEFWNLPNCLKLPKIHFVFAFLRSPFYETYEELLPQETARVCMTMGSSRLGRPARLCLPHNNPGEPFEICFAFQNSIEIRDFSSGYRIPRVSAQCLDGKRYDFRFGFPDKPSGIIHLLIRKFLKEHFEVCILHKIA